jgi:GABA(A) receptor-associated protein
MYKAEKSFEERKKESELMQNRFPDRIPVIVQKKKDQLATIDKRKFMAPNSLTMGQFVFVIRKRLKMNPSEAIFLFVNNKLVTPQQTLGQVYTQHHDDDGFLYLIYDFENAFG